MRSTEEVQAVLRLHRGGANPYAISRQTGVPRSTAMYWIRTYGDLGLERRPPAPRLPPREDPARYAYLLGMYLGDGWIERMPRTFRLFLTLDATYPGIVGEARTAVARFAHPCKVRVRARLARCVDVMAYGKHWPDLLPQHGSGRKHLRRIELVPWQEELTTEAPHALIRGLIHSDGCRCVAKIRSPKRAYSYHRYYFSNRSSDIREIFCRRLDLLDIRWTRSGSYNIQVARRAGVEALDAFVGPKY